MTMATLEEWDLQPTRSNEISAEPAVDFDVRFADVHRRLIRICASLVGAEAEDVVQDTYLAARDRFRNLRDRAAFEGWVIRIAVNRCMDRHRRGSHIESLTGRERTPFAGQRDVGLRELIER